MVRSAAIGIRVEPAIKEALERAAKEDGRTVASYLERVIIAHLKTLDRK